MQNPAAGILESNSLATAIEAADQMLKSASINNIFKLNSPSSFAIIVRGDAPSVEAALSAGERFLKNSSTYQNSFLIRDVHNDIESYLNRKESSL